MITDTPEGCILQVKVLPKAKRNEIVGWEGEALKVRLAAVPEKGAANDELVRFLALVLSVRRADIVILAGATSRHKRLCIHGATVEQINERLHSTMQMKG